MRFFYQKNWTKVGPDICLLIKNIFSNRDYLNLVNEVNLVLVLKVDCPSRATQFRPINLCNVSYKIVTKVIAKKLKKFMDFLVMPNQSSFIPGRHSSDNIIIAQEIFHSMRRMKGKKGVMVVKVDLEKAFDNLH